MLERPNNVNAKTYKIKSQFIKKSIFITCGYIKKDEKNIPIEIFINSKDLTMLKEFTILTRLISAIFRRNGSVKFVIEELSGISDPEGSRFSKGKHYMSIYDEIAETIKKFFKEINYEE